MRAEATRPGGAVIQTYTPENDVIQAAAAQDYQGFYDAEIALRRLRQDPPFADQFTVTVTGPEETPVRRAIELLRQGIGNAAEKPPYDTLGIQVIGPGTGAGGEGQRRIPLPPTGAGAEYRADSGAAGGVHASLCAAARKPKTAYLYGLR